MITIASVGFWHLHGADYAGEAQRHPEVNLVAGWDPDPERLRVAAERFGLRTVGRSRHAPGRLLGGRGDRVHGDRRSP